MREGFGVGIGTEGVAELGELLPQDVGVLNDPVMNHRDRFIRTHVRMRVAFCRRAVRGPARMGNPDLPRHGVGGERALQLGDLPRRATSLKALAIVDGHARGIVAAILKALEAFNQEGERLPGSDVTDDTAHIDAVCCKW